MIKELIFFKYQMYCVIIILMICIFGACKASGIISDDS